MKKNIISLLSLVAGTLLLAGSVVRAADADGNWIWTNPGRNGGAPRESVLSLKADGSQLSGKLSTPGRDGKPTDTPITNGKVDGNNFSFDIVRQFNGNSITISYSGTVADGQITGKIVTVRDGEPQTRDWTAKNAGDQAEATAVTVVAPKPGYDENGHKIVNTTHYKEISVAEAVQFLADHPDAIMRLMPLLAPSEYASGHLPETPKITI